MKHIENAIIYALISSETNADGHGFSRLYSDCSEYAKQHGYGIACVRNEVISGTTADRPVLMDILLNSECKTVIVADESRLARSVEIHYLLLRIAKDRGVTIISSKSGITLTDTSTDNAMGSLIGGVMSLMASHDRTLTVTRLKAARDAKSQTLGKRCEGRKSSYDGNIDLMKRIHQLRRKRGGKVMGARRIAAQLQKESWPTESGKPWCYSTVSKLIPRAGSIVRASNVAG